MLEKKRFKLIFVYILVGCLIAVIYSSCNQKDKSTGLIGAGSSFDYPLFSSIFSKYHDKNKVQINYQSIGSGGGVLQLTNKTIDFGASDAPLNNEQTEGMGAEVLHIPVCIGATVVSYNIPGVKDTLNFSPNVLSSIFLGKIKNWDDPAIKKDNPNINFPNLMITVVHRSDGSGTSFIFTDFLSKVNPEWKNKVGVGTSVNWPIGLGGKGNEGVAGLVKLSPGNIGYIELSYAVENKMSIARIENQDGKFISPTIAAISASAEVELPADAKTSITNSNSSIGYPISSFSWVIIYKEQNYKNRSREKAEALLQLFWWVIHDAQKYNADLHYAPLPTAAIKVTENILKSAIYDGSPILSQQ
ncbi:phosphate transport system substrate-binding protein [Pedobacter sp. UYEF25]